MWRCEDLWQGVQPGEERFDPRLVAGLPAGARGFLEHAIAPGTPLASAVRLRMHGEIRLRGKWYPFAGEEVIHWQRGMVWQARVRMGGLAVRGRDWFVDGQGGMRWRLLGLLPLARAEGPDIDRSAADRLHLEVVWLPSVLCDPEVQWTVAGGGACLAARFSAHGRQAEIDYLVGAGGGLEAVSSLRWGDADGQGFQVLPFGGVVEAEATFAGYTIPSRLRVGWFFGTDRFEPLGEFFRVTIDQASFR